MKYKVIICDFDGTLVGSNRIIPDPVKDAIRKVIKNEYSFSLASGRLFNGLVENTCKELQLTSPQITRGGAEIIDPLSREVLSGEYIPDHVAVRVISFLQQCNTTFMVEAGDVVYTPDGLPIVAVGPVPFKKITELVVHNIPKISIGSFASNVNADEMEDALRKEYPELHIIKADSPSGKSWDITASLANKHAAVLKVAKLFGVSPKETIGIGDGYNDFPLLEACGFKVAMGNANESLKAIANYVAPSVEENGVAVFIEHLLHDETFQ